MAELPEDIRVKGQHDRNISVQNKPSISKDSIPSLLGVNHLKKQLRDLDAEEERQHAREKKLARIKAAQRRIHKTKEEKNKSHKVRLVNELVEEDLSLKELEDEIDSVKMSMDKDDLPPPAFDQALFKESHPSEELPPPTFESFIGISCNDLQDITDAVVDENMLPVTMDPSAPPMNRFSTEEESIGSNMKLNQLPPPPSFSDFENQEAKQIEIFPEEQKSALVNEQAQILQQFEAEKAANDLAISKIVNSEGMEKIEFVSNENNAVHQDILENNNNQTIQIDRDNKVVLKGAESTALAIKNGTAAVVQCILCKSWLQINESASLMFCPSCSTVTRVQKQSVVSLEKAKEYMKVRRRKEYEQKKHAKKEKYQNMSWGQYVKSFFEVDEEISSFQAYPASRQSAARDQTHNTTETLSSSHISPSLYANTHPSSALPSARIAEKKPLFSCVTNLARSIQIRKNEENDSGITVAVPHVARANSSSSDFVML